MLKGSVQDKNPVSDASEQVLWHTYINFSSCITYPITYLNNFLNINSTVEKVIKTTSWHCSRMHAAYYINESSGTSTWNALHRSFLQIRAKVYTPRALNREQKPKTKCASIYVSLRMNRRSILQLHNSPILWGSRTCPENKKRVWGHLNKQLLYNVTNFNIYIT